MRKIILGLALSLDGRIEGANGEYDWCFTDQDYGMTEFLDSIDTIFYGRKSYEMMLRAPGGMDLFKGKTNYVFSSNQSLVFENANVVAGNLSSNVDLLKSQSGKDIWLFGGAELTKAFLELNLVDELWLSVHPIILGSGKLLFDGLSRRIQTKLIETKTYNTGLVSVRYAVLK